MEILMLIGSLYVGLLFFWAFESHKYILKGKFDFKLWREQNLAMFIWSFVMCSLCIFVLYLGGEDATRFVFKFMGINMDIAQEFNGSGIMMGIIVGYATRRLTKPIKRTWLDDEGNKIVRSKQKIQTINQGQFDDNSRDNTDNQDFNYDENP